ncbi:MAG TPA: hypothetical protein PLD18_07450 [Flavobacterium sp.]|nr:hypothetical protein [Flavobacterium sp.]
MKLLKIYCLISFLFLLSCGHKTDGRCIITKNKSKNKIYCLFIDRELNTIDSIPKIRKETIPQEKNIDCIIVPYWEEYIKTCDDQKIRYYIIKKDSVDKYGWKTIFAKNIYNKKYLFTIEDLDKINWEIEYKGE